ncbi:MAG: indole-3-glycerol phosphate synthase TrpC [Ardenticatenia bacterium]|nr:indole-3-glycerol phosphate synthase TrpC [Ardenticatenia bacterium]
MGAKTILERIVRWKHGEIERHKQRRPPELVRAEAAIAPRPRDLEAALQAPGVALIAEVKRASPSKGLLRHQFDPVELATVYEANGAAAISVLTDQHFFQGNVDHLRAVRRAVSVPVLRKDFILDPYQVYEARAAGADAVLLIVAVLGDTTLAHLHALARELGMAVLVEVHNENELERALSISPTLIGINNRDLRTFHVDLNTTARLCPLIPAGTLVVAESGIHSAADVRHLAEMGVDAILVGEAIVRAKDVAAKVQELASAGNN